MKKIVKILALVMAFSIFTCVFMACSDDGNTDNNGGNNSTGGNTSTGEGTKYTLVVWGAQEDQAMLKEMCNAYAAANPQNTYKFLFGVQSESDAADKVLNDLTSGPDVFSFASDQINKLVTAGALARLGGNILEEVKSINSPESVDAATVKINGEDMTYAYPSTGDNCYFLYYDKSKLNLDDVATLDGILAKAASLNKKVHYKLNEDGWYLSSFFFSNPNLKYDATYDANMTETAVSLNYNNAEGLEVMKALRSYLSNGALVANTDDAKLLNAVANGEAIAAVSGTWNAKAIQAAWGDNMGVIKLPTATIGGQQKQLTSYFGYKLMGVNNMSKNKGEAHKLAMWLTNQQNQLLRFQTRGFGPTNKVVADMDIVKNDLVMSAVFSQQQYSRTQKGVPGAYWTPMSSLVTSIITSLQNGEEVTDATLQESLDALVAAVNKTAE